MHLFCIKPFHSDNSPKTADKYKFQRLDSCMRIRHESHFNISIMELLVKHELLWNSVFDKQVHLSYFNDILVTLLRTKRKAFQSGISDDFSRGG